MLDGIQRGIVRIIGDGVGAAKVPVVDVLAGPEAVLIRLAAEIRLEVEHAPGCVGAVRLVQQLGRAVGAGRTADVVRDVFLCAGTDGVAGTASPISAPGRVAFRFAAEAAAHAAEGEAIGRAVID